MLSGHPRGGLKQAVGTSPELREEASKWEGGVQGSSAYRQYLKPGHLNK